MIGGMNWISTLTYIELIARRVQRRANARATAPLIVESLDFGQLEGLREGRDWEAAAEMVVDSAVRLERAGAEGLLICANTMHKYFDRVIEAVGVPVIHVADCLGARMAGEGITNAALIGRRNVMTDSFFRERLVAHGIDLMPPNMDNVEVIDRIIYEELMVGKASRNAQRELKTIITQKEQAGAKAIVLACTELELVVDIDANVLPIFDSTRTHCDAAVDWMMGAD
ncbi:aspartate/glutamate racemase family protein [Allopontixanthobacter sp.]|uniref:aspartate/glutamate racemase family protein n=1 Tax=Allopontixanthobacter sp. TaxID=2906452 RepID=UPI002AB8D79C|nr:amino acid racemase [Allopontixanthobacter sp.]MDZ4308621.1 amino acid racemase [Allopontixanthobacter sp.]